MTSVLSPRDVILRNEGRRNRITNQDDMLDLGERHLNVEIKEEPEPETNRGSVCAEFSSGRLERCHT